MRSCLFVQWKAPTDASRFVIDGSPSEYIGTEQQDDVMRLLADIQKYKEICNNKDRDDLSPSFRFSHTKVKGEKWYFVEGNFEETDVAGRKLVYIFATQESDFPKIVDILIEYASTLGVTTNSNDIEVIKTQTHKKKQFFRTQIWITITIIILLLLFMLLNLQNKP
jgi:hypothetical protein